jgi:hypothetical protein
MLCGLLSVTDLIDELELDAPWCGGLCVHCVCVVCALCVRCVWVVCALRVLGRYEYL